MLTIVYLLLGVAFMGGLFYALMQITARQRRLNAEMTRLERLAAEVSLNAEAILDRVDERVDRLNDLLARAEAAVAAVPEPAAPEVAPTPVAEEEAPKKKRTRKPKEAAGSEAATPAPTSIEKYQKLRDAVRTLSDQGKDPSDIAQELGIPRGEVLLLLNLRAKKVTA
ncbi:MAG TPA: hypothetical protein VD969_17130 [Symbiobacteriaceae bacterium]|nr:hypothetical protein [Symbiobacteriaceae bacterium]